MLILCDPEWRLLLYPAVQSKKYLITSQVSRYCLLALQSRISRYMVKINIKVDPYNAEIFLCMPKHAWKPKGFFQFDIIINVLVSSFWFILIHMLWFCGHYTFFNSFSAGIDFRRQNLTSTDVRFWRLKTVPALKGLEVNWQYVHESAKFIL